MPATTQPAAQKAEETKPKLADRVYVKMTTSMGDMILELNQEKAPITVQNFLSYADEGFYNGTIFHRVIPNFVIQGGGYDADLNQKPAKAGIKNEWQNGLKNLRGTLAMARMPMQPDSATSQFFINVKDNPQLDTPRDGAGYAVFGKVIQGMDVVDKIKAVPTAKKEAQSKDSKEAAPVTMTDVPVEPVVIKSVVRAEPDTVKDAIEAARAAEAEEAKKKMEAFRTDWNKGTEFIKGRGVDVTKGATTPTGLWYVDVAPGSGEAPKLTDRVKVHYTGWLVDGTKFDSSVDRGQPFEFTVGRGVIKGWTEGVSTMKVGGRRYLLIPPELAYGVAGSPPKIPPSAVLVFEIELLGIVTDQPSPPPAGQPPAPKPGQPATPPPAGQPPAPKPAQPTTPPAGQPPAPKPAQPTPPPAGQPPAPKPAQPPPPPGQPQQPKP
ncbi:MAG TPA: peptidylprolyl isomerase [Phycisphaerae bacterium]|nr:peptidylprolyl isomerase [Phycisphaerae bacterium]